LKKFAARAPVEALEDIASHSISIKSVETLVCPRGAAACQPGLR
jgi:hypothetical protein